MQTINKKIEILNKLNKENEELEEGVSNFPLNSLEEFQNFVHNLCNDQLLRQKFQEKIRKIGGSSGKDHLVNCLVKMLTNKFAHKITWEGQRQTRGIKDTMFSNILIGTILNQHSTATQTELSTTFSEWLRRAGDRYRYHLKTKNKET